MLFININFYLKKIDNQRKESIFLILFLSKLFVFYY